MGKVKKTFPVDLPFEDLAKDDSELKEIDKFYYDYLHSYSKNLKRWIRHRASRLESYEVEEIYQETILKALEKRHQLRDRDSVKTWLFSIGTNTINEFYRIMEKREKPMELDVIDDLKPFTFLNQKEEVDFTFEEVLERSRSEIIRECLMELDEKQRYVIRMHHYQDLTFREIAEITNVSINAVYGWYRRGKERMRRLLIKKGVVGYE